MTAYCTDTPLRDVTITAFRPEYTEQAVSLFLAEFARLRSRIPAVPDTMASPATVTNRLDQLFDHCPGVAAIRQERLVGYLGWRTIDDFRRTGRRSAYCPAWGHAAIQRDHGQLYQLLYQAACRQWTDAGCQTHAVTLLANDRRAAQTFFFNGFGVTVIDAIRPIDIMNRTTDHGTAVRKTTLADLDALAVLESEHRRHYPRPPILMPERDRNLERIRSGFAETIDSTWLATSGDQAIGFLRFEPNVEGASDIVASPTTAAISDAFVRPAHRTRGVATDLLNAALREYARAGFTRCSVDFESFNPEARAFWLRSFSPVCLSVIRHPEAIPAPG